MLIRVVQRRQGLMMAAGNPEGIESISDLAEKRVRFVNRQLPSGTRLIFDHLLEQAGIAVDQIQGYTTEEFTHLAVAAIVASGAAEAGFGIEAAGPSVWALFHAYGQRELLVRLEPRGFKPADGRRPFKATSQP